MLWISDGIVFTWVQVGHVLREVINLNLFPFIQFLIRRAIPLSWIKDNPILIWTLLDTNISLLPGVDNELRTELSPETLCFLMFSL